MLERIKLVLDLTAPIGGALLVGWWVLHWGQGSVLAWCVVPLSVLGFNLWWHRRWRHSLVARVVALDKGVDQPKPHDSDIGRNTAGTP